MLRRILKWLNKAVPKKQVTISDRMTVILKKEKKDELPDD